MTAWGWVTIGAAGAFGLSALVALTVAAILGSISRDVSQLLNAELWSVAPLKRAKARVARA
jgi:hypothetical protein